MPIAIATKPKLHPWNVVYFDAFHALQDSHDINDSGYQRIKLSEITSYFVTYEVGGVDNRDYFIKMIKALDSVWVPYMNERLRAEMRKRQKAAELKAKQGRR